MKLAIVRFFLLIILFLSVERFCHKQTHGFRTSKIKPRPDDFQTTAPTALSEETLDEIKEILAQPFHFMNSGGECYVFVSESGHHVLKFFKHHHMRKVKIEDFFLPGPIRRKIRKLRLDKRDRFMTSCLLANEHFSIGTGLIYLHLTPTSVFNQKVRIFDPIGCVHQIDLDTHTFALQRRAHLIYPSLQALIEMDEVEAVETRIASYVQLIASRCDAGLQDHDARKRNFGFIGQQAIELDLGSFTLNETLKCLEERNRVLIRETLKMKRWLSKRYPKYLPFFESALEKQLSEKT